MVKKMFTQTVSNVILGFHDIINTECNNNSNYLDCVVNFYVELITYGIIFPFVFYLYLYNCFLHKQILMFFYFICMIFIAYF